MIQVFQLSIQDLSIMIQEAVALELKKVNYGLIKPNLDDRELLTREQVSKLLNVSFATLFHWNNNKILTNKKIGRKVFYLKEDVINKLKNVA